MKLMNTQHGPAVLHNGAAVLFSEINAKRGSALPADLLSLIQSGDLSALRDLRGIEGEPLSEITPELPFTPPKIWCIGLNYKSHAEDINAVQPEEPGSFMKPASCLFRPGGDIVLPPAEVSNDVDAEGELGVVIGRRCRFGVADGRHRGRRQKLQPADRPHPHPPAVDLGVGDERAHLGLHRRQDAGHLVRRTPEILRR